MPDFVPFRALRYAPSSGPLEQLTAPPYDVLSDEDVEHYRALHPANIVRVDVPRESDGPDRYRLAASTLDGWIRAGTLIRDEAPSFTIYRMRFRDAAGRSRAIDGVLGGLEVVDAGSGGVLPHERVTPKATTDRLDLTRATDANLSPVWGLSLARGLTDLLAEPGESLGCLTSGDVEHCVERVTDPDRIEAIRRAIGADDVLIADGHHRYGIARTHRDERRAAMGPSAADQTLCFVNELIEDQLSVEAIHRLYDGIPFDALRTILERSFALESVDTSHDDVLSEMQRRGSLCLVAPDGQLEWLSPRPGAFDGVRNIDGALLEHALRDTAIEVRYQHGLEHVLETVTSGAASAGVLIRPVGIAEIERTAREGLLMPPKSTFFTPKLQTGLVIRPLD